MEEVMTVRRRTWSDTEHDHDRCQHWPGTRGADEGGGAMSWTRVWPDTVRRAMLDPEADCALCGEPIQGDEPLVLEEVTGEVRHPECIDDDDDDSLTDWGEEGYAWME